MPRQGGGAGRRWLKGIGGGGVASAHHEPEIARQGTRTDQLVYLIKMLEWGGTGAAYLLRRLPRTAPDVLAALMAGGANGEIPQMHHRPSERAIAAGMRVFKMRRHSGALGGYFWCCPLPVANAVIFPNLEALSGEANRDSQSGRKGGVSGRDSPSGGCPYGQAVFVGFA